MSLWHFAPQFSTFQGRMSLREKKESVLLFFCNPGNQEACQGPVALEGGGVTKFSKHQVGQLGFGGVNLRELPMSSVSVFA